MLEPGLEQILSDDDPVGCGRTRSCVRNNLAQIRTLIGLVPNGILCLWTAATSNATTYASLPTMQFSSQTTNAAIAANPSDMTLGLVYT